MSYEATLHLDKVKCNIDLLSCQLSQPHGCKDDQNVIESGLAEDEVHVGT